MIEEIYAIERQALTDSPLHRTDARVKIILTFATIITIVSYPYSTDVIIPGTAFFIFFALLWAFSKLSPVIYLKRVALIMPFGLSIIFFQIFFRNMHYETFTSIASLPFDIHIYLESVEFACILLVKFIICISFIILLSSTTTMQEMLSGAHRLGLPSEFTLIIGLMIRYLFVFADIFCKMTYVFETRCFNALDRKLPHKYRLRILGYAIGTFFIRSYEQGERTYTSMLCRGYSKDSLLHNENKQLNKYEICFLGSSIIFIITVPLISYIFL